MHSLAVAFFYLMVGCNNCYVKSDNRGKLYICDLRHFYFRERNTAVRNQINVPFMSIVLQLKVLFVAFLLDLKMLL